MERADLKVMALNGFAGDYSQRTDLPGHGLMAQYRPVVWFCITVTIHRVAIQCIFFLAARGTTQKTCSPRNGTAAKRSVAVCEGTR